MDSTARELDAHLRTLLIPAAGAWGIHLGEDAIGALTTFGMELLRWNERVNLTRIVAPRDVVIRHFMDSLACARAFDAPPPSLADLGTGAGFPGIPLKLVWPELRLTLNDSVGKKTAFLEHIVRVLDLRDVVVVTSRAEAMGRDPAHRGRYAGVTARAVAALDVLSEYALPLCAVGGRFVAPKGGDGAAEAERASRAVGRLGGRIGAVLPVELPDVEPRTLVIIDKVKPTPADLPRAAGVPSKRPL